MGKREAVAVTLVVVLFGVTSAVAQTPEAADGACVETLRKIGEIGSHDGVLKGTLRIKNALKTVPGRANPSMMRYFEGIDERTGSEAWPPDPNSLLPGPTLRVGVGERVELTFLNKVDVGAFPKDSLDRAERGLGTGCDEATNITPAATVKNWYPGVRGDTYPNCFHGSSTGNIHFHGLHVSPSGFADNVLVQVRPDPKVDEAQVAQIFKEVFAQCAEQDGSLPWKLVPAAFREFNEKAVKNYDLHAIWKGVRGPIQVDGREVPALPLENQLSPENEENIAHGRWPQYFAGAFPNCFKVTDGAVRKGQDAKTHMAQAPGTHWYHSHKHGSTSINLYNGLAGPMIVEGDYDEDLEKIYPDLRATQKVMIVQTFMDLPDLLRGATQGFKPNMTNGSEVKRGVGGGLQTAPTIVMQPEEIQLWRIINAMVNTPSITASFSGPSGTKVDNGPTFRQIAQDGVQFSPKNYRDQPLTTLDGNGSPMITLAPGQRIDILVRAPALPEGKETQTYELSGVTVGNAAGVGVVNLTVCGKPKDPVRQFPIGDETDPGYNYPVFPEFLKLSGETVRIQRKVSFDWEQYRINAAPAQDACPGPPACTKRVNPRHSLPLSDERMKKLGITKDRAPIFMVDGEQFSEGKYYQTMQLGQVEEWTISNTTNVPHPFHIHVSPFQVLEVFDPNVDPLKPLTYAEPVWQDVVMVPAGLKYSADVVPYDAAKFTGALVVDANGRATTPGWVKIRSRFADFDGSFVLHCHILGHEDRGMMQLVRVVDAATTETHH